MSLDLPSPVATYLAADRSDIATKTKCFTDNAVVKDEGVDLRFSFGLEDEKIASLEIIP